MEAYRMHILNWLIDSIQDETNGRVTVGTTRFDLSSTMGLLVLAPLDVVVGVILLGVHGGDDVDGLVDCVAFTRFANKTPSYCTPFSSIETTNCCSPVSEPVRKKNKNSHQNAFKCTTINWFAATDTYIGSTIWIACQIAVQADCRHWGDHCCRCDSYYLYHFDDLMMEVRRTCADETMSDFDYHESWANRFDAHGCDRVQSIDCDDLAMKVTQNGDDAHDYNGCAVKRVATAAVASVIDGVRLSSILASHSRVPHAQNHCRSLVHVWCHALANQLGLMPLCESKWAKQKTMLKHCIIYMNFQINCLYLCGSLLGGLVVLLEVGGLVLLLYIDQRATRPICDISNAFNASALMQSGLCGPVKMQKKDLNLCCCENDKCEINSSSDVNTYVPPLLVVEIVWCIRSCAVQFQSFDLEADPFVDLTASDGVNFVWRHAKPMIMVTFAVNHLAMVNVVPVATSNVNVKMSIIEP